ncbi:MAG TPA: hypothetical protein VLA88_04865 [Candidatus Saccharimonadales bacterium]|nr:hypothetical protein [Candidatus Saccharimonadales bacterium]
MRFTTLVLVGNADSASRAEVERFAGERGFTVMRAGDVLDGETGEVATPIAHIIQGETAVADRRRLKAAGIHNLSQITRLPMAEAWRQLQPLSNSILRAVILYMDAHNYAFADGPATPMANAYRRRKTGGEGILPELRGLKPHVRTALNLNSVLCIELVRSLTDADLLGIQYISRDRLGEIRRLVQEYDNPKA